MRSRAFTIIELMVVVLIVTAISAIIIPGLAARVAGSRLDGAVRAVEFGAALASGEAMRRGEIVALVAERDRDGSWVLWAETVAPDRAASVLSPEDGESGPMEEVPPEGGERPARTEVGSFAGVELSREVRPPAMAGAPGPMEAGVADQEPFGGEGAEEPFGGRSPERWVLGVFFPDGSARAGATVYLASEDGREQRSVRVRALAGGVESAVVNLSADDGLAMDEREAVEEELYPPPPPPAQPGRNGGAPPGGGP